VNRITSEAELRELLEGRQGFIYNDFAPSVRPDRAPTKSARDNNLLHGAWCSRLVVSLTIAKYHAPELEEAWAWLTQNRGEEPEAWHRCKFCLGLRSSRPLRVTDQGAAVGSEVIAVANTGLEPFREATVESMLVQHLESHGHAITMQFPVPGGRIDVVATREGQRLVIEVKGEDSGQYGSAQMNFLQGVGQIASRMVEEGSEYALAFPNTQHFRRVLKTFQGSVAFQRLSLNLFVVQETGDVEFVPSARVREWVDGL
jgi:hypothetical protein